MKREHEKKTTFFAVIEIGSIIFKYVILAKSLPSFLFSSISSITFSILFYYLFYYLLLYFLLSSIIFSIFFSPRQLALPHFHLSQSFSPVWQLESFTILTSRVVEPIEMIAPRLDLFDLFSGPIWSLLIDNISKSCLASLSYTHH